MAKPTALDRLTFEEFLLLEEASPVKHDFIDGRMVERFAEAMAGGSRNHILITPALGRMLGNALRGRKCRSLDADAMVRVDEAGKGYYPDAAIACPPNFLSDRVGVIDNPTVLFEILSPNTEKHDRGEKFHNYRLLPSLRDYVLVATDRKDGRSLLAPGRRQLEPPHRHPRLYRPPSFRGHRPPLGRALRRRGLRR